MVSSPGKIIGCAFRAFTRPAGSGVEFNSSGFANENEVQTRAGTRFSAVRRSNQKKPREDHVSGKLDLTTTRAHTGFRALWHPYL